MAPRLAIDLHTDGDDLLKTVINFSSSGLNAIVPAVGGQIIRLYKIFFVAQAATVITYQDGSTPISGPIGFTANGSMTLMFDTKPWFITSAGNALNLNSTNAVQVGGTVYYTQG